MQVFKSLNSNPNLSLALGYFDGVHLAHQKLISTAVEYAKNTNKKLQTEICARTIARS